jgi:cytochrome oxidase Cu insertion factor (SCO1/SenC/PrrC family)
MLLPPRRLRSLLFSAALAGALGVCVGIGIHLAAGAGGSPSPSPTLPTLHGQAVWDAGKRPAPAFALRDQARTVVSLAAQRGHTVVLAFMDPLCKQECPIEGRELAASERQVAPAERPVLLIVSVNPKATAADARAAARNWGIAGDWHWLLGGQAQLARVWRAYRITVVASTHDIVHSTAVYVIDKRGFERVGVIAPFLPQFVGDDLRALAREQT